MKRRTMILLIIILIALMTQASTCFDFIKPFRGQQAQDVVDDLIEESDPDDQPLDLNLPDDSAGEGPEDWYEPQVPFTELYDNLKIGALDWMFDMLYPTATNEDRAKVVFTIDPNTGQLIYSIEGQEPGLYLPQVDQAGWGNAYLQYSESWSGPPPDEVFPCGEDPNNLPPGQDWFTVCPPGIAPSTGMNWYIVYTIFEAPIPWDDPNFDYTYAAVFDGDGNTDNNFQYIDPYNWDYWQNTDQFYVLDWIHRNQSWHLSVMGQNWEMVESSARVIIYDNALFWLIEADDFSAIPPAGRVSSFATPGGWELDDVGGEVNGNDPAEPLTPLTIEVIPVNDPPSIDG